MSSSASALHVNLLGGFEFLHVGHRISLPLGAQRLLAFLGLQDGGIHRAAAAERLWPDSSLGRAAANLRSALWGCRRAAGATVIECAGPRLRLSPTVCIDLHELMRRTRQILEDSNRCAGREWEMLVNALGRELLPVWSDDWLMLERERWDQVRLHTLESLAKQLRSEEQYLGALQTALAVVAIEPFRETAHRIVIEVHVAEGNVASALKHYQRYRALLHRELGVAPSRRMTELANALMLP
jgi:DNA-binding SARP family transcriptional activator